MTPTEVFTEVFASWPTASKEKLVSYYTDDFMLVDPTKPKRLVGKKALLGWFDDAENLRPFVPKKMIHLEEVAENTIYAEFYITVMPEDKKPYHILFRSSMVWEQVDGEWKMKYEQYEQNSCDKNGKRLV